MHSTMYSNSAILLLLIGQAAAFPWVVDVAGVDSSFLKSGSRLNRRQGSPTSCPVNPNHEGAVPYNPKFPYCGAQGTKVPATFPCLNNQVPAPGDDAHRYIAPGPLDTRGPCPGMNVAANHGFLSRDGITTYDELVEAQQNLYGVGYDLAHVLAIAGVGLDGDVVTGKVSLGCDATDRTGSLLGSTSGEPGLNGHNRFEGDASLTRGDYFNGDNWSFNRTMYDNMMTNYCKGNCNREALSLYRKSRWEDSKNTNPNFYFGPGSLITYGAATFLYALMPSNGTGIADKATMDSFFIDEKLPENWFSRPDPYDISKAAVEILGMYTPNPVSFGINKGRPNSFVGFGLNGATLDQNLGTVSGIKCMLYSIPTQFLPATLFQNGLSAAAKTWALTEILPIFDADKKGDASLTGCPIGPHEPTSPL